MAEHSYGVEIPPEVVRHPFLLQAGKASASAFAFANDIIGLKADLLRGIRDNLVLSLQEGVRRRPAAERRVGGRALPSGSRGILRPAGPVPLRRGPAPRPRPTARRRQLPSNPRRLAVRGHQMAATGHRPLRHDHPAHPPREPEPTPGPGRIPCITERPQPPASIRCGAGPGIAVIRLRASRQPWRPRPRCGRAAGYATPAGWRSSRARG
jgi:terpene synthase-like protein